MISHELDIGALAGVQRELRKVVVLALASGLVAMVCRGASLCSLFGFILQRGETCRAIHVADRVEVVIRIEEP